MERSRKFLYIIKKHGDLMDCGSSGPVWALARSLCSVLGQVYKWTPAAGLAYHPGVSRSTPSRFTPRKREINASLMGIPAFERILYSYIYITCSLYTLIIHQLDNYLFCSKQIFSFCISGNPGMLFCRHCLALYAS